MATLLEKYGDRLRVAEAVYGRAHSGEKMSKQKQIVLATLLNNQNKFLKEALDSSVGTQRSDMGLFMKFSLNLTTVGIPNLIAHELVIVHPMTAMSGYVNYIEYTTSVDKGQSKDRFISNPFGYGDVDSNYTSEKLVVEDSVDGTTIGLEWTPVIPGTVDVTVGTDRYVDDGAGKLYLVPQGTRISKRLVTDVEEDGVLSGVPAHVEITFGPGAIEAGTVTYTGEAAITFTNAVSGNYVLRYSYNNVVVPQAKLPMIKAEMKAMPLLAKARRIAVYFSQIAAFQAKNDYGIDLADQLAEKACGELAYEIDTEVTQLLIDNAEESADLVWSKTAPIGVSMQQHFAAFTFILQTARKIIYQKTKKFAPNWILVSASILPVLSFIPSFQPAPAGIVNGPYFAGTVDGLKVFVTPNIAEDAFVVGVLGNDMMSAAAVYAPYMPIVPTQLLQYADGGTTQGWSTLYDIKILNKNLLVAGRITA